MRCSVYTVGPSVLSCSNHLKLYQTLKVKNIFKQEKNAAVNVLSWPKKQAHPKCVLEKARVSCYKVDMKIVTVCSMYY